MICGSEGSHLSRAGKTERERLKTDVLFVAGYAKSVPYIGSILWVGGSHLSRKHPGPDDQSGLSRSR